MALLQSVSPRSHQGQVEPGGNSDRCAPEVLGLKLRSDLHLSRKIFHAIGVLVVAGLYQVLSRETGLWTLGLALIVLTSIDVLRLRYKKLNSFVFKWFGILLRREEAFRLSGMTQLLVGAMIIVALFPKEVSTLAFLFLAFGDPIASAVGVTYGKDKILPNKSLQGSIAAFVTCMILSAVYFSLTGLLSERIVLASLLGGLIGALAELSSFGKLDDNFTLPVFSATLLWVLFWFFGGFA